MDTRRKDVLHLVVAFDGDERHTLTDALGETMREIEVETGIVRDWYFLHADHADKDVLGMLSRARTALDEGYPDGVNPPERDPARAMLSAIRYIDRVMSELGADIVAS